MAVITITSGYKSRGEELAQILSEKLGYKTIYKEIITDCARKYNIMENELLEELEELPSRWRRLTGEQKRQLIYIKCSLLSAAQENNIIYYGPCGQIFLSGINNVFKLRIESPFDKRVKAVMKDLGKNQEDASKFILNIDKQRSRLIKLLYDDDWQNPSLYDMSVNIDRLTLPTICEFVISAVQSEEFQTNDQTALIIKNKLLESEVKAAISADIKIRNLVITIVAMGDTVTLRGAVKNKKQRDLVVETVEQVKGVKKCEVYLGLLSSPIK